MVKFDISLLRFLEDEDFRVLTALEMAHRNHDIAPTVLIERIAGLPHGGCRKRLTELLKHKLIHHECQIYDGYAMKYASYDFLALRTFSKRGTLHGVGSRIGCGKESDIMLCQDEHGNDYALKLQRLGRCSFRSVSRNRDYKDGRKVRGESWFYLSRLAATKEFAFMKALYDEGFPVPKPIDHNRHAVVMEYINGTLLNTITAMEATIAQKIYERILHLLVKLAQHGLIHGDFNEFNIFVTDDYHVVLIDFPQMVSIDHHNAAELFDRDVQTLAAFFHRRFKVETLMYPSLTKDVERTGSLDKKVHASGWTKKDQQAMDALLDDNDDEEDEEENESENGGDDGEVESESEKAVPAAVAAPAPAPHTVGDDDSDDGVTRAPRGKAVKPTRSAPKFMQHAHKDDDDDDEKEAAENGEPIGEKARRDADDAESSDESGDEIGEDVDNSVAQQKRLRQKANPNFAPDGSVDLGYIRSRLKQGSVRQEELGFRQNMHRNMQKGKDKRSVRRHMKNARFVQSAAGYDD